MLKTVLIYGVALALGAVALQWLEFGVWARAHFATVYVVLIAMGFLGLGVWVGARLFRPQAAAADFQPNLRALASLGITGREYEVLRLLASGRSISRSIRSRPMWPGCTGNSRRRDAPRPSCAPGNFT
jgi:NarL family two-component system response regulator LiaR